MVGAIVGGGVLSLGSLVGFVTVLGIAARNGIMLVSHYRHLELEEGEPFGLELVIRGSEERLAPILMTALATGLALVPLAWAGNKPGHEIEHPMAVVILGGLVTSTRAEPVPDAGALPGLRQGRRPARGRGGRGRRRGRGHARRHRRLGGTTRRAPMVPSPSTPTRADEAEFIPGSGSA